MTGYSMSELANWDGRYNFRPGNQDPYNRLLSLSPPKRPALSSSSSERAAPELRSLDTKFGAAGTNRGDHHVKPVQSDFFTKQSSLLQTNLSSVMDGIDMAQVNGVARSISAVDRPASEDSFTMFQPRTQPPLVSQDNISSHTSSQYSSKEADEHQGHPTGTFREGVDLVPHALPAGGVIDLTDEDADGEDETEEMCIDAILRPSWTSPPHSPYQPIQSHILSPPKAPSRFSPPSSPRSPPVPPYESLFTPPPTSSRSLPRKRKNLRLSHVSIPPFPAGLGKRDYRPVRFSSLAAKNDKHSSVRLHPSIEEALKAALQHNASINTHVKPEHDSSHAAGSLKRKRTHQGSRNTQADQETRTKQSKVQAKAFSVPTEGGTSTLSLHNTHVSTLHDQAESFLRLLFDVVDPMGPLPSSYAALVSSTRHLQPKDYRPPYDESGFAQVKPLPVLNGPRFIFPHRELSPSSGDEVSLNDGFYTEDDTAVLQTSPEMLSASAGPSRTRLASSSSPATKRTRAEYNSLPLSFQLSAKGLGKRKAVEESSPNPSFQPSLSLASQSVDLGFMGAGIVTDIDHYFNDLGHVAAAAAVSLPADGIDQTSFEEGLGLIASGRDSVSEVMDTFCSEGTPDLAVSFISTETPIGSHMGFQQTKDGGSLLSSAKDNIDHFLSGPSPADSHDAEEVTTCRDEPWLLNHTDRHLSLSSEDGGGDSPGGYIGNGTIDPSLLLGGGVVAEPQAPSPSPSLSRSPSPDIVAKKPSRGVPDSASPRSAHNQRQSTPLVPTRVVSKRVSRAPIKADMLVTDQLDLSSEWDSDEAEEQNSSDSDDGDFGPAPVKKRRASSYLSEGPHSRAITSDRMSRGTVEIKSGPLSKSAKPGRASGVPTTKGPSFTFCHHCRSTTWRLKMTCCGSKKDGSPCGKHFCQHCINKRYPDITFILDNPSFVCPWCNNTCRCTQCTRKRGEVYIGERTNDARDMMANNRITDRRRAGARGKPKKDTKALTTTPQPLDPTIIAKATKFWGTIYGLTGERVGKAFVSNDGDDRMVVARPTSTNTATRPRNRKRRVFVGKAQEWWGIKRVRDLEPSPPYKGKGKHKARDPSTVRFYIGKRSRLHAPLASVNLYCPRSPSPAFSIDTSTSTLPTDDEGSGSIVDAGEGSHPTKLEGLPHGVISLGEDDVERAIAAALGSLL